MAPTGALGNGLSLTPIASGSTATISGTPTAAVPVTFTVTATDLLVSSDPVSYTITIFAAPTISPTSLPQQDAGAYSQGLTATGGQGSYTWAVSGGSLPSGTTLNSASGVISGSAAAGTYNFTITVTDSA